MTAITLFSGQLRALVLEAEPRSISRCSFRAGGDRGAFCFIWRRFAEGLSGPAPLSDKGFDVFHRFRAASLQHPSYRESDRRHDPQRVAQVIREVGAPVIGLQEVNWRPGGANSAVNHKLKFLAHLRATKRLPARI